MPTPLILHRDFHQALHREPPGVAPIHSPLRRIERNSERSCRKRFYGPIAARYRDDAPGVSLLDGAQPCANEYRHRRITERCTMADFGDSRVKTERESLETELLRDERNRLIQEAIDRLPPQCRAAFALRYFTSVLQGRLRSAWNLSQNG